MFTSIQLILNYCMNSLQLQYLLVTIDTEILSCSFFTFLNIIVLCTNVEVYDTYRLYLTSSWLNMPSLLILSIKELVGIAKVPSLYCNALLSSWQTPSDNVSTIIRQSN